MNLSQSVIVASFVYGLFWLVSALGYGLVLNRPDNLAKQKSLVAKPLGAGILLTPMVFNSIGVYFVTGLSFWQSLLGWTLMVTSFIGLAAGGVLAVGHRSKSRQRLTAQLTFTAWLLLLGSVLPLVVLHTQNSFDLNPLIILALAALAGLGLMLINFIRQLPLEVWSWSLVLIALVPPLLSWSARPALIADRFELQQAINGQNYGRDVAGALVCLVLLIVVSFWLSIHLPPNSQSASNHRKTDKRIAG